MGYKSIQLWNIDLKLQNRVESNLLIYDILYLFYKMFKYITYYVGLIVIKIF